MSENSNAARIDLTPEYRQNLRTLAKRYRSIRSDLQMILNELQAGNFIGDRIPGIAGSYILYKARVRNSDIQKGKSGGYRLIYLVESPASILLLTVYSKSDREDINTTELRSILRDFYN